MHILALIAALVLLIGPASVRAEGVAIEAEPQIEEIESCIGSNLPRTTGRIAFSVEIRDRAGETTDMRAEFLWYRASEGAERVVLRVSDPVETAGTSLLMVEKQEGDPDLFVFLPEISKVKQVRSGRLRGPVLGTDFSYEDLEGLGRGVARATLSLLGTEPTPAGEVWVVEAIPAEEDRSEYERILVRVDRERCLPTRFEFFADERRLRKVLSSPVEGFRRHGESWLPHRFEMRDLVSETRTLVQIEEVELDALLTEDDFTAGALLYEGRSLSAH